MKEDEMRFNVCGCHHDALVVVLDSEDSMVEFSIWRWGFAKIGWLYRLRHIWHIIRYGTPYTDEVLLSEEQAVELGWWLVNALDTIPF